MKNFHEWYVRFMPHAKTVIEAILAVLSRETGRTVEPLRVEFQFKFIAHDFRDQNSNTETKNFQVIRRLVSQIPDETGKVSDTGSIDLLSRVDYKVLKWIGEPDNRRNLIYGVEAPGNKNFTSLWLTFGYVGTTYTNPQTGERESFQPSSILTEHESAYRFLRDNAINGFLSSILAGYSFKTTSGIIP